jgi:hypothetical protein
MTFAEAMAKSDELRNAAYLAIALRRPEAERKAAVSACIQFNPYMYAPGLA